MCVAKEGCLRPEELKGAPKECTPDQIRKCHGDAKQHPCLPAEASTGPDATTGCEKPDQLKGSPQDCSPEQIRKCHGDSAGHPCTEPG